MYKFFNSKKDLISLKLALQAEQHPGHLHHYHYLNHNLDYLEFVHLEYNLPA